MIQSTTTTTTMSSPNHHSFFRYTLSLLFLGLTLVSSAAAAEYSSSSASFGFKKFNVKSEHLWSLYGDAKLVRNGSYVQIDGSWKYSSGSVMYKQPVKLLSDGNHPNSFGTYFVFSLSPENGTGSGLAFQLVRNGKHHSEFSVDLSGNHVGVRVGNKQVLLSQSKLLWNMDSGNKLQCWIDYEASSKRIEVRISRLGERREDDSPPLFSCKIDLTEMFKDEGVFLELYAKNVNSTQVCEIYGWSFKLRRVPTWQHSEPLDPQGYKKEDVEPVVMHSRSGCVLRVVTALVFGTGCGALGALIVLCVWTVVAAKKPVAPQEYVVQQPVVFDYDKVKVIVIDKSDCGKN